MPKPRCESCRQLVSSDDALIKIAEVLMNAGFLSTEAEAGDLNAIVEATERAVKPVTEP